AGGHRRAGRRGAPGAVRAAARAVRRDAPRANLVHRLVEDHCEAGLADAPAVVDDELHWSFAELGAASARAAGALRERGVRRGERVAILLPDGRHWCAAFLGAARLGAVAIPLAPAGEPERLARLLEDRGPAPPAAPDR